MIVDIVETADGHFAIRRWLMLCGYEFLNVRIGYWTRYRERAHSIFGSLAEAEAAWKAYGGNASVKSVKRLI